MYINVFITKIIKNMSRNCIYILFVNQFDTLTKMTAFFEHLAHMSDDWKYNEVHAELIIPPTAYAAVWNESNPNNCIVKYNFQTIKNTPNISFLAIPVHDVKAVSALAESIWKTCKASYKIPFSDLALPSFLVHDYDNVPQHWDHLYCSQFVLLFLRICTQKKLLNIPEEQEKYLDEKHCNSVTCTPARLKLTLDKVLNKN